MASSNIESTSLIQCALETFLLAQKELLQAFQQLDAPSQKLFLENLPKDSMVVESILTLMSERAAYESNEGTDKIIGNEVPVVFLDIEATGDNPKSDRIIEIAMIKLFPDDRKETFLRRIHPGTVKISLEAQKIHKISLDDLAGELEFPHFADDILAFIEGCWLGGYNLNRLDIPLLEGELGRIGKTLEPKTRKYVDAFILWQKMERRDLGTALKYFCGKILNNAHGAEADVAATIQILRAQLEKYKLTSLEEVTKICSNCNEEEFVDKEGRFFKKRDQNIVFGFGKHQGKSLKEVYDEEPHYFEWMERKGFPADTLEVVHKFQIEESKTNPKSEDAVQYVDADRRFKIRDQDIIFNFGKKTGLTVSEVFDTEPEYFGWMLRRDFFSPETKEVVRKLLQEERRKLNIIK